MPTDKERREVARRLRELHPEDRYWWGIHGFDWYMFADYLLEAIGFDKDSSSEWTEQLADLIEPSCDRDALLALADELDRDGKIQRGRQKAGERWFIDGLDVREYARRIREALGASE